LSDAHATGAEHGWVFAVERAYVAAATGGARANLDVPRALVARARAAAFAVSSRFLAVGTPRSFGVIVAAADQRADAELVIAAHRTWFAPRDLRIAASRGSADDLARALGGDAVAIADVLASDIACVLDPALEIRAPQLRRGTHLCVIEREQLDPELLALATITDEPTGLPALAAGLVDGRQLDELTAFIAGDAPIAASALM